MKISKFIFTFFLFLSVNTFAQEEVTDTTVSSIEVPEGWLIIDTTNFSFSYPEEWNLHDPTKKVNEFMISKSSGNPKSNTNEVINLGIEKFGKQNYSLNKYSENVISNLKKSLNKFKLLSKEKTSLNEQDCMKIVFSCKIGKYKLQFAQYIFIENRTAYILNFTASKKDYPISIISAQKIMKTFTIK